MALVVIELRARLRRLHAADIGPGDSGAPEAEAEDGRSEDEDGPDARTSRAMRALSLSG